MLKIGLTQRAEVIQDRNERRDCLDQAWTSLLLENSYLPIPLPNRVKDVDALIDARERCVFNLGFSSKIGADFIYNLVANITENN